MADEFQQLPILATAPTLRVNAMDPDARSNGDGHLSEQSRKRPNPRAARPAAPPLPHQPAEAPPSALLQDEVHLMRSARTLKGEEPSPLSKRAAPLPEEATVEQPLPQHIHVKA